MFQQSFWFTRNVDFIKAFKSVFYGGTIRNLFQVSNGHYSFYKPSYRRSRAGKKVRERLMTKTQSISTCCNTSRHDVGFTHHLHKVDKSTNHWTIDRKQTNRGINRNNLRNLPKNSTTVPSPKTFKFANVNVRSVKNKVADIVDHVVGNKVDLCVITETWMKEVDTVCVAGLSVNGYLFKHIPRQTARQGGGTGIMYRESLDVSLSKGKENKSFELSEWKIDIQTRSIKAVAVYRPPYSEMHPVSSSVFFEEFSLYLESIVLCPEILLITSDFNFHLDNPGDPDVRKFNNLLETFGLVQHISLPTHISGHILDPIITRSTNDILVNNPRTTFAISDHFFVECYLHLPSSMLTVKEVNFRNLKQIDMKKFIEDIASSDLINAPTTNLDELVKCYNDTLLTILNTHAPVKTKVMTIRPKVPWFNDDLKNLKTARRKLERKMLKHNNQADKKAYYVIRNKYSTLLRQARVVHYTHVIYQCAGDSKKLFHVVRSLCHERQVNNLPPHTVSLLTKLNLSRTPSAVFMSMHQF